MNGGHLLIIELHAVSFFRVQNDLVHSAGLCQQRRSPNQALVYCLRNLALHDHRSKRLQTEMPLDEGAVFQSGCDCGGQLVTPSHTVRWFAEQSNHTLHQVGGQHCGVSIGKQSIAGFFCRTPQTTRVIYLKTELTDSHAVDFPPSGAERQQSVRVCLDALGCVARKECKHLAPQPCVKPLGLEPLQRSCLSLRCPGIHKSLRCVCCQYSREFCRVTRIKQAVKALPEGVPKPASFYCSNAFKSRVVGQKGDDVLPRRTRHNSILCLYLSLRHLVAVDCQLLLDD